jgi:hypothetical protein
MKRASPDFLSPRQAPVAASNDGVHTTGPTPRRPLTDRTVRHLQPRHGPVDVRDGSSGLILTVLPSGRKQFSIRYRFGGTQRRLMFGEYPAVSLAMARKRARHADAAIDDGRDPAGEQHAAKARPTDTVAALVIPGEYAKNGRAHRVPLVRDAIALIRAQQKDHDDQHEKDDESKDDDQSEFVFVGSGGSVTRVYDRYSYDAEKRRALGRGRVSCVRLSSNRSQESCCHSDRPRTRGQLERRDGAAVENVIKSRARQLVHYGLKTICLDISQGPLDRGGPAGALPD